jgi:hypothetical protein
LKRWIGYQQVDDDLGEDTVHSLGFELASLSCLGRVRGREAGRPQIVERTDHVDRAFGQHRADGPGAFAQPRPIRLGYHDLDRIRPLCQHLWDQEAFDEGRVGGPVQALDGRGVDLA